MKLRNSLVETPEIEASQRPQLHFSLPCSLSTDCHQQLDPELGMSLIIESCPETYAYAH